MKATKKYMFAARFGPEEAKILAEAEAKTRLNRAEIVRRALRLMSQAARSRGYEILICS